MKLFPPITLTALGLLIATGASAQKKPASPPTQETPNMPSQELIDKTMAAMERNARETINPAYAPLFDALAPLKSLATIKDSNLDSPYTKPLTDSQKFLVLPQVQQGMTLTRNWISGFTGPDPNFHVPPSDSPLGGMMGMMGIFSLASQILPVQTGWAAETRIALATGQRDPLFRNLEDNLRLTEAFSQDTLMSGLMLSDLSARLPVVYATALECFTPKDCDRLMQICDRWESGNGAWEIGLERSLRIEQEQAMSMVNDDGSLYDPTTKFSEIGLDHSEELNPDMDLANLDVSAMIDAMFKSSPRISRNPTPDAQRKRQQIAEQIAIQYTRVHSMLADPFAPTPPPIPKPEWLQKVDTFSLTDLADSGIGEMQKWILKIRLLKVHIALRKFRWQNDRLPVNLAELEQPRMIVDPMTKKPFEYKTDGETYTLTSATPAEVTFNLNGATTVPSSARYDLFSDPMPQFSLNGLLSTAGVSVTDTNDQNVPVPPVRVETKPDAPTKSKP